MNQTIPEILAALDEAKAIVASKATALPQFGLTLVVDRDNSRVTLFCPREIAARIDVTILRPDDPDPYGHGGPHDSILAASNADRLHLLVEEEI